MSFQHQECRCAGHNSLCPSSSLFPDLGSWKRAAAVPPGSLPWIQPDESWAADSTSPVKFPEIQHMVYAYEVGPLGVIVSARHGPSRRVPHSWHPELIQYWGDRPGFKSWLSHALREAKPLCPHQEWPPENGGDNNYCKGLLKGLETIT